MQPFWYKFRWFLKASGPIHLRPRPASNHGPPSPPARRWRFRPNVQPTSATLHHTKCPVVGGQNPAVGFVIIKWPGGWEPKVLHMPDGKRVCQCQGFQGDQVFFWWFCNQIDWFVDSNLQKSYAVSNPVSDTYFGESLFIVRANGELVEHQLCVKPLSIGGTNRVCDETPIELHCVPTVEWQLGRWGLVSKWNGFIGTSLVAVGKFVIFLS